MKCAALYAARSFISDATNPTNNKIGILINIDNKICFPDIIASFFING